MPLQPPNTSVANSDRLQNLRLGHATSFVLVSPSSDSSDNDDEYEEELLASDATNAQAIANLYKAASPRSATQATLKAGINKKTSLRLAQALIDARAALLEHRWTDLFLAFRALDKALEVVNDVKSLGWRLPILSRLTADAILSVARAMLSKRSLPADEAKSLSKLKQKLPSHPYDSPWAEAVSRAKMKMPLQGSDLSDSECAILDCFDLNLLSDSKSQGSVLCLSNLDLHDIPVSIQLLRDIRAWYDSFEPLEHPRPIFQTLDLTDNSLSDLPWWLPSALPDLQCLKLEGNPMATFHPSIMLFRKMQSISQTTAVISTTNALALVEKASAIINQTKDQSSNNSLQEHILPLSVLCLDVLDSAGYDDQEIIPDHLRKHWKLKRHVCASCKQRIFEREKRYIPESLREKVYLFSPPLSGSHLTDDIAAEPAAAPRTAYVIGGEEWRFCAHCLWRHCCQQAVVSDDLSGCECMLCTEEQQVVEQESTSVRWARRRVM